MSPKSPSFFDRLSLSRSNLPILPLHTSPNLRKPEDYDLDDLSPRPEDGLLSPRPPDGENMRIAAPQNPTARPAWLGAESSEFRDTSRKPKVMFAGPPPPIAKSMMLPSPLAARAPPSQSQERRLRPQNV